MTDYVRTRMEEGRTQDHVSTGAPCVRDNDRLTDSEAGRDTESNPTQSVCYPSNLQDRSHHDCLVRSQDEGNFFHNEIPVLVLLPSGFQKRSSPKDHSFTAVILCISEKTSTIRGGRQKTGTGQVTRDDAVLWIADNQHKIRLTLTNSKFVNNSFDSHKLEIRQHFV